MYLPIFSGNGVRLAGEIAEGLAEVLVKGNRALSSYANLREGYWGSAA